MNNETTASQPKSIGDDAQFRGVIRAYADKLVGSGTSDISELVAYLDSKLHVQAVFGAKPPQKWQERIVVLDDAGTMLAMSQEISEWRAPAAQASATIRAAPDLRTLDRYDPGFTAEPVADGFYFFAKDVEELLAATIQEPVMVAEPVDAFADVIAENERIARANMAKSEPAAPMVADPAGVAAGANLYRKTSLVSAEQFLPAEGKIPDGVISDGMGDPRKDSSYAFVLDTKEGRHVMRAGDYVCTGVEGEKWNVEQSIFEKTYELAATVKAVPSEALDAARYRFLRKGFGDMGPDVDLHNAFVDGDEKMDAAIDAAIKSAAPLADKTGGVAK